MGMDAASRMFVKLPPSRRIAFVFAPPIAVVLMYFSQTSPLPDITRENYEKIQEGMTVEQIEKVLDGSAGAYGFLWSPERLESQTWGEGQAFSKDWITRAGWIEVGFTVQGQACCKT